MSAPPLNPTVSMDLWNVECSLCSHTADRPRRLHCIQSPWKLQIKYTFKLNNLVVQVSYHATPHHATKVKVAEVNVTSYVHGTGSSASRWDRDRLNSTKKSPYFLDTHLSHTEEQVKVHFGLLGVLPVRHKLSGLINTRMKVTSNLSEYTSLRHVSLTALHTSQPLCPRYTSIIAKPNNGTSRCVFFYFTHTLNNSEMSGSHGDE
jgi:hypothetical protein